MSAFPSLVAQEAYTVIQFPLWWYGAGFIGVLRWLKTDLQTEWNRLGIRLWIRSWLRPMYGVSDVVGRLVSVLMRTVVIGARICWWFLRVVVYVFAAVAWLAWLPLALGLLFLPLVWH